MPEPLETNNLGEIQLNLPQTDNSSQSQSDNETYGNQFLNKVDPNDRPYVEKYIKEWDGGVTQRFQELQGKLKPWEELDADYESVQAAIATMRWADQDPLAFYNAIRQQLEEMDLLSNDQNFQQNGQQQTNAPVVPPEFDGVPEAFVKEHLELRQKAEKFDKFMNNYEDEKNTATNQAQLDKMMKELHTKHGRFDEDAVLAKMIRGMKPDDAVKEHLDFIKEISSPQGRQAPPPVLGSGRTAVDQVDSSKLKNSSTRRALVAEILGGIDS
jgi:hypothetical protein